MMALNNITFNQTKPAKSATPIKSTDKQPVLQQAASASAIQEPKRASSATMTANPAVANYIEALTANQAGLGANPTVAVAPRSTESSVFLFKEAGLKSQADEYLTRTDSNKDGRVNFDEMIDGGGLTGEVKTSLNKDQARALWASIAGPDGQLDVREYAQTIVGFDENNDGKITQQESDILKVAWANEALQDPGKANVQRYNMLGINANNVTGGKFDSIFAPTLDTQAARDASARTAVFPGDPRLTRDTIDSATAAGIQAREAQELIDQIRKDKGLPPVNVNPPATAPSTMPTNSIPASSGNPEANRVVAIPSNPAASTGRAWGSALAAKDVSTAPALAASGTQPTAVSGNASMTQLVEMIMEVFKVMLRPQTGAASSNTKPVTSTAQAPSTLQEAKAPSSTDPKRAEGVESSPNGDMMQSFMRIMMMVIMMAIMGEKGNNPVSRN